VAFTRLSRTTRIDDVLENTTDEPVQQLAAYQEFVVARPLPTRHHPQLHEVPETVKILRDTTTNGVVYLIGTAHFRFVDVR
jgi:hypothetical protein